MVIILSVGGFLAATFVAWIWFKQLKKPTYFKVGSDYTALAALVLAAGAVERFLEPFSQWLMPKKAEEKKAAESKDAAEKIAADPAKSAGTDVQGMVQVAATEVAKLDKKQGERAIVFWAIASSVSLVAPLGLGVFFLRAVASAESAPNRYLDMVFTALVIGAGTKPLHDTIASIEKKKEAAEGTAATATAGAS